MASTLSFHDALEQASVLASQSLPAELHERLSCAVALVKDGRVFQSSTGEWQVDSASTKGLVHSVNGHCDCADAHYHQPPQGLCKHRLAVYLSRKAVQLMHPDDTPAAEPEPTPGAPSADPVAPAGIDPRFLTHIHGKAFVQYAGLLAMAHTKGLISLSASFISVTKTLALAQAKAAFRDGTEWTEAADASPENVPTHIRPHFARLALTRAKSRALRDALNISMAAVEELAD